MAFIELGNTMFRGTLRGATGVARFKLTVDAINAVDTVNIGSNQVTYSKHIVFSGYSRGAGSTIASLLIDIPDDVAWVEVVSYCNRASTVSINGSALPNRNKRHPDSRLFPAVNLIKLTKGTHIFRVLTNSSGQCEGYAICRYIRITGAR